MTAEPRGWRVLPDVKRSKQITLVLSGAMAAWPLGCEPQYAPQNVQQVRQPPPLPAPPIAQSGFLTTDEIASQISTNNVYTNNQYIPRVGYYHAPFNSWYPYPYNYFSPGYGYFHGGTWALQPHAGGAMSSMPSTPAVARARDDAANKRSSSGSGSTGFRSLSSGGSSTSSGSRSSTSSTSSSGTSRGGFGSSGSSSSS